MKTPQPGDIVTPKKDLEGFSTKNQYQVIERYKNSICLIDDDGHRRYKHISDFHNITQYPIWERICNFVNKILGI